MMYLDQLPLGIVTPSMVFATDYCRTPFVFRHYRETSVTTNVVKSANNSVLRKYQEYRICSNVIPIIASRALEAITVRDTVPSLQDQSTTQKVWGQNLRENGSRFQPEEILACIPGTWK